MPDGDPAAGYRDGKLKFELRGEKLQGHWTLVRMGGKRQRDDQRDNGWLLIKERDEYAQAASAFNVVDAMPDSVLAGTAKAAKKAAKKAPAKSAKSAATKKAKARDLPALPEGAKKAKLPLALAPQLATLVEKAPADSSQWQYEIKFDGYRVLARVDGDDVRLFTRQGNDWTSKLRALAAEIRTLGLPDGWLDGEIVVVDAQGITDFQALQNAFETSRADAIQFYAFDLPYYAGHDLRAVPLDQRRLLLRRLFEANTAPRLHFSESFEASPDEMLAAACRMKLEGVIGKRNDAPYVSTRANTWIKLKCTLRQEFVIGGFTDPKGSRSGLGSLLLGVHDAQGKLRYAGNVGTGFDTAMLGTLRKQLDPGHGRPAVRRPAARHSRPLGQAEAGGGGVLRRVDQGGPRAAFGVPRPAHGQAGRRGVGGEAGGGGEVGQVGHVGQGGQVGSKESPGQESPGQRDHRQDRRQPCGPGDRHLHRADQGRPRALLRQRRRADAALPQGSADCAGARPVRRGWRTVLPAPRRHPQDRRREARSTPSFGPAIRRCWRSPRRRPSWRWRSSTWWSSTPGTRWRAASTGRTGSFSTSTPARG